MNDSRPHPGGLVDLAGHQIARIGFGAMQFEKISEERAITILRQAVDAGVDMIDTAQFYGPGLSNSLIKKALHPYADNVVIVSKVGTRRTENGLAPAQRPEELREQVEANLASLGLDSIPVVNLRRSASGPGPAVGTVAAGDQVVSVEDQLAEMIAMRDEGLIGGIGLSTIDADTLRIGLPAGIVCVQNAYSVLDRSSLDVLEICRAESIAWVPYFPLGSAFDRFPNVADNPVVIDAARSLGVTPAQVGLAWLLAEYDRTLLIAGTSDPAHLAENLAVGDVKLDAATIAALDAIA